MEFSEDLVNDSFNEYSNSGFVVFKSIDNKIYLIYSNNNKSLISYDIINKKKLTEIKNAHNQNITSYKYILDNINKKDLVLSVSEADNNIKLWNINIWECLLNIQNINKFGRLHSACFLNFNKNIYIITSNLFHDKKPEPIKIFDLNGKKIKELHNSSDRGDNTHFIDSYYTKKSSKVYILTCKENCLKIYDYIVNKIYNIIYSIIANNIVIDDKNDNVHIICSCHDGLVRIWDFDSAKLLTKIKVSNNGLFEELLWNSYYLFVGTTDNNSIKMIDLKKKKIIHSLNGHNNSVRTIKIINIPEYGECLLSQGLDTETIKLWKFKTK